MESADFDKMYTERVRYALYVLTMTQLISEKKLGEKLTEELWSNSKPSIAHAPTVLKRSKSEIRERIKREHPLKEFHYIQKFDYTPKCKIIDLIDIDLERHILTTKHVCINVDEQEHTHGLL